MAISVSFKVSGSGGTTFALDLELQSTIADVKSLANEKCSIDPESMKIIYKGRILKDTDTLESHKVESGSTMHVVKSAATQEASLAATSPTATTATTDAQTLAPTAHPSPGVPGAADGNPAMMQAVLQMMGGNGSSNPGASGIPTADGMRTADGMDPASLMQMLNNPMIQQMMQNLTQNPQMLQQMIQNNPMLQTMAQQDPVFAQMMHNPQVMQQMLNPETLQAIMQMQNAMGGINAGTTPGGSTAATHPNPGMFDPTLMEAAMQAMMAGGSAGGGVPARHASDADMRPLEERFESQQKQLVNMGFSDSPSNLQALQMASGDVNQAINFLLEGGSVS
jgi:ubiquilin